MELVEAPYRLSSVLNDLTNMVSFRARATNLTFEVTVEETLPDMNGPQVLQEIRRKPSCASVPVFFLTGLQDFDSSEYDVTGCLFKSLSQEEIASRIASVLSA